MPWERVFVFMDYRGIISIAVMAMVFIWLFAKNTGKKHIISTKFITRSAVFAAISQGVVPGVYHFSNEGVCSWYDFTKAIHRLAGITACKVKPLHTEEYPTKAQRPHYSVLDKTKIKETYHIEIPYWMDSLQSCITELEA